SQTITATGGTPPLLWSATGNVPPGLTLNATNGAITGTPTTTGTSTFTARVQDLLGNSASKQFSITITTGFSITTPTALPSASEGVAYTQTLQASGGTAPLTWTVSVGTLPTGLNLNPDTGVISGTPAAAGSYSFIIQVADSTLQIIQKAFTLTVGNK